MIFDLYAHHSHTLDSLIETLAEQGVAYTKGMFRFTRSKLHSILRDRSYIGEVRYQE